MNFIENQIKYFRMYMFGNHSHLSAKLILALLPLDWNFNITSILKYVLYN